MPLGYAVLAVLGGMVLPLQALVNARLGREAGGAIWAVTFSLLVSTLVLAVALLALRPSLPNGPALKAVPWWVWGGGAMGAFYLAVVITAVPRLGAAALIALVVFGQMTASLALDHYGVLNAAQPITAARLLGAALLLCGVVLIVRP
jgi:transporter family-2 protein